MPFPSLPHRLLRAIHTAALALLLLAQAPVQATPLMDLFPEDILPMAQQLKPELHLNANQQILWRQTEQKTQSLVRQRQLRRDQLQAETARNMSRPGFELRDLGRAVDQESALADNDNRQLRELWLTVADALDDTQRQAVQSFIADRLQRVAEHGGSNAREKSDGARMGGKRSMGGGMGGGGGGADMGGSGSAGGMGNMGGSGQF